MFVSLQLADSRMSGAPKGTILEPFVDFVAALPQSEVSGELNL